MFKTKEYKKYQMEASNYLDKKLKAKLSDTSPKSLIQDNNKISKENLNKTISSKSRYQSKKSQDKTKLSKKTDEDNKKGAVLKMENDDINLPDLKTKVTFKEIFGTKFGDKYNKKKEKSKKNIPVKKKIGDKPGYMAALVRPQEAERKKKNSPETQKDSQKTEYLTNVMNTMPHGFISKILKDMIQSDVETNKPFR